MGSLAGGEQSARQPPAKLQLAKSPVPPSVAAPDEEPELDPEEDPEPEPEEDPEDEPPEEDPDEEPPEEELPEEDPEEAPDDEPELDPLDPFPSPPPLPGPSVVVWSHAPRAKNAKGSAAAKKERLTKRNLRSMDERTQKACRRRGLRLRDAGRATNESRAD
jgi:hypothetical protein